MDRERAKQLLPVIEAFSEGRDIQFRYPGGSDWGGVSGSSALLDFEKEDCEFRIKPEPREFLVKPTAIITDSAVSLPHSGEKHYLDDGWIKVREVIDE